MHLGLIAEGNQETEACNLLGSSLQDAGAQVTLMCETPPRNSQLNWLALAAQQAASSELTGHFDSIGIFAPAKTARKLHTTHRIASSLRQQKPIPLFSGPTRLLHGDALTSDLLERLDFDIICLQGESQKQHLEWMLKGSEDRSIQSLAIGLWCLPTKPVDQGTSEQPLLVIIERSKAPPASCNNALIYKRICAVAKESPNWQIRIQPDEALDSNHTERWPEASIARYYCDQSETPANLQLGAPEDLQWALCQASACLGVNSDWLLPPMIWGKPTVVLADYGIRTELNGPLFLASGAMHHFSDCLPLDRLISLPNPNPAWLENLGWAIADGPQRLLNALQKFEQKAASNKTS